MGVRDVLRWMWFGERRMFREPVEVERRRVRNRGKQADARLESALDRLNETLTTNRENGESHRDISGGDAVAQWATFFPQCQFNPSGDAAIRICRNPAHRDAGRTAYCDKDRCPIWAGLRAPAAA